MSPVDSYSTLAYDLPDTWLADLLECGHSVNEPDKSGAYMLGLACERLQLEHVKLGLLRGADPNCRDIEGNTPLLCAIDFSHHNPGTAFEIVKLLVAAGADIESRGYMGKTPFLKASTRGCLDILKFLVSSGCNIHAKSDPDGFTGIDCATTFNNSSKFKAYVYGLYNA